MAYFAASSSWAEIYLLVFDELTLGHLETLMVSNYTTDTF